MILKISDTAPLITSRYYVIVCETGIDRSPLILLIEYSLLYLLQTMENMRNQQPQKDFVSSNVMYFVTA